MNDPNRTQMGAPPVVDPNRTIMGAAPTVNATVTIKPVQCPVCKTFNPPGVMFCVECGLIFDRALPDDAFGAPPVRLPCFVDEAGREHPLRPGQNVLGRLGDVQIEDARISRRHAVATMTGETIEIEDAGSTNGTKVNDQALAAGQKVKLTPGDRVSLGGYIVALSRPGESAKTEMGLGGRTMGMAAPPAAQPTVATLVVGDQEFGLKAGENTLGRRDGNDVVLAYPFVSGRHASIFVEGDRITFTDVGSTNGSFKDDVRLEANIPVEMGPTEAIRIGDLELRVKR